MIHVLVGAAMALAATSGASATPQGKPQTQAPKPQQEQVYCLEYERSTGSRVSQTECRTKSQWRDAGVEIDALTRKTS